MAKSIIQNNKACYVCGSTYNLHLHHIFNGIANRRISDKDGCTVYLCFYHHNGSAYGVHYNKALDLELKRECEKAWLEVNNATVEDFIKRYGKNYL